jgi:hypothetical protein
MKMKFTNLNCRLLASWRTILVMALLGVFAPLIHAQNSPVGIWDCVMSGQRQGTAYFEFLDDGTNKTLNVIEVMVPNGTKTNSTSGGGRNNTGGRGDSGGSSFVPSRQIFGSEIITNGVWALDVKGHTIGFFVETSFQLNCVTTPIPTSTNSEAPSDIPFTFTDGSTNDPTFCVTSPIATNDLGGGLTNYSEQTICYTNISVCSAQTNAVSFVGTVVPGKKITLKGTTPFGNTMYQGVPAQSLLDISGSYYGTRRKSGVDNLEFFTLTPSFLAPNVYDVALVGPGYQYHGISILSSKKRISFSLGLDPAVPTNQVTVVRAVTGPFNPKKISAKTVGWDQPEDLLLNPVHFDIQLSP